MLAIVSIPFKRESTCAQGVNPFLIESSKRESTIAQKNGVYEYYCQGRFNSLQTGKHMCTVKDVLDGVTSESIEFGQFQFPSNGKAHVHSR